jgi:hypothetical protein
MQAVFGHFYVFDAEYTMVVQMFDGVPGAHRGRSAEGVRARRRPRRLTRTVVAISRQRPETAGCWDNATPEVVQTGRPACSVEGVGRSGQNTRKAAALRRGGDAPLKVWLDDVLDEPARRPPEGWVGVKTPAEAIELLKTGRVVELSLDHDLGVFDENGREETGYDVLLWIEEQVAVHGFIPPSVMKAHSSNSSAHDKMLRAIGAIERLADGS